MRVQVKENHLPGKAGRGLNICGALSICSLFLYLGLENARMSSHHFVKEGQEPAMLIMEGASFDSIASLLEWSPRVLVASNALERVLTWGISIDAVIAIGDTPATARLLEEQSVPIIPAGDVFHALRSYLKPRHSHEVTLAVDDLDRIRTEAERHISDFRITIVTNDIRWIPITSAYEKWLPAGSELFIRESANDKLFSVQNLREEGGSFVVEKDGLILINSSNLVWVGESL